MRSFPRFQRKCKALPLDKTTSFFNGLKLQAGKIVKREFAKI